MKKNKISKNWVNKQRRDIYVRQSKIDGYRARSAYKLMEIDEKFSIFKGGLSVVDIGAAPGSWSQYAEKKIKNGKLISIDLKTMEPLGKSVQIQGDFTEDKIKNEILKSAEGKVNIVMSDMAVNTTGNKSVDSLVTGELSLEAMKFALKTLKKNGIFVSKVFMGSSFNQIVEIAKKNFKEFHIYKPPSSRKESKENFIICKNLRQ